uniref:Uncharacterized protein n=1 Tax=Cynoglossus semilaevis TaxID=244447 RepID=A0A3P8X2S5_CYNSE
VVEKAKPLSRRFKKKTIHKNVSYLAFTLSDREELSVRSVKQTSFTLFSFPDTGISSKDMSIVNSFVNDVFERITSVCWLITTNDPPTRPGSSRPLSVCCVWTRAVTKYTSSK